MKILLLGENGQLGSCLKKNLLNENLISASKKKINLCDTHEAIKKIEEIKPNIIINAAAYTNVNLAEENGKEAYAVNSKSVKEIAKYSYQNNILLVHYSTDYIFDGKNDKAKSYKEDDVKNPLNIYGKSKLEGENYIINSGCRYIIFRTSWVYSDTGNNFANTILDLACKNNSITVIKDEFGVPTHVDFITKHTLNLINSNESSALYHLVPDGVTNRFDFALYLIKGAKIRGKNIMCPVENVLPIDSKDSNTKIKRPLNAILNCDKIKNTYNLNIPDWRVHAELFLNNRFGEIDGS
tara:strand:- start:1091 stop:1978 length:888 start_codon:yes stop_codon:yes gene_type:complete